MLKIQKTLALSRETLRNLNTNEQEKVQGGYIYSVKPYCQGCSDPSASVHNGVHVYCC